MSVFDEVALRALIREVVLEALREHQRRGEPEADGSAESSLDIAAAARLLSVAPQTIRDWIRQGRLTRYHAGRELRVSRRELHEFARTVPDGAREESPEERARQYLAGRRHQRRRPD